MNRLPCGSDGKESACNVGEPGLIPGSQRFPLEKGLATHSSILTWRPSWTEEPSRLQCPGLGRVRHDWATDTFTFMLMNRNTYFLIKSMSLTEHDMLLKPGCFSHSRVFTATWWQ